MNKQGCQRMLLPHLIVQPKIITIKASALTKNCQSHGIISKIGSFLSSLWNKVTEKTIEPQKIPCPKECSRKVVDDPLDEYMSIALPVLDPYKFQGEFNNRLAHSSATKEQIKYSESDYTDYIEDEGFYYLEDPLCTPAAKKLLYGDENSKMTTAMSEDKASWADTYGSESDSGASLCREPTVPTNPPLLLIPPAIDNLLKKDLPSRDNTQFMAEKALEMIDDEKPQEPIMTLPFTTQAEFKLPPSLCSDTQNSAGDFSLPTTMEMTISKAEDVPTNFLSRPVTTSTSWSQMVYHKNTQ